MVLEPPQSNALFNYFNKELLQMERGINRRIKAGGPWDTLHSVSWSENCNWPCKVCLSFPSALLCPKAERRSIFPWTKTEITRMRWENGCQDGTDRLNGWWLATLRRQRGLPGQEFCRSQPTVFHQTGKHPLFTITAGRLDQDIVSINRTDLIS